MKKLLLLLVAVLAIGCTKEESCGRLSNIESTNQHPVGVEIEFDVIVFTYDSGNKYVVAISGEDYSHLSDLDECELQHVL